MGLFSPRQERLVSTIKVVVLDTVPLVWRRIALETDSTLDRLATAIQDSLNWTRGHPHYFVDSKARYYKTPAPTDPDLVVDEREIKLSTVFGSAGRTLAFIYDPTDEWELAVTLESVACADKKTRPPLFLAGHILGPPEGCGGLQGYHEMIAALRDIKHPARNRWLAWLKEQNQTRWLTAATLRPTGNTILPSAPCELPS